MASPQPLVLHGTPSGSFSDAAAAFSLAVKSAATPSEIIACVERLLLLFGKRRSRIHPNPAHMMRQLPMPHLVFADKPWIPGQYHTIPCPPVLWAVFQECSRLFGDSPALLYHTGEEWLPSHECGLPAARIPLDSRFPLQPDRNALINFLIERGTPALVIDFLVGHNSGGLAPQSCAVPSTGWSIFCAAASAIEVALSIGGLSKAAEELALKLRALPSLRTVREPGCDWFDRFHTSSFVQPSLASGPAPLSLPEDHVGSLLLHGLRRQFITLGAASPRNSAAVLVALSLESGMPLSHVLEYSAYIRCGNFVLPHGTDRWIFLCPMHSQDAGGLSLFPIALTGALGAAASINGYFLWRHRDYLRHRRHGALDLTPITGVEPADLGKIVNCALRHAGFRHRLSAEEAVRLLTRVTAHRCRMTHAGAVLGATCCLSTGLNHVSVADSLREMGISGPLIRFDGSPWVEPWEVHAVPKSRERDRWVKHILKCGCHDLDEIAQALSRQFYDRGFLPCYDAFHNWERCYFERVGEGRPKGDNDIARRAFEVSKRKGWLRVSEPTRLPSCQEMESAIARIPSVLARCKPTARDGFSTDKGSERQAKKLQLASAFEAIFDGGLRVGEAIVVPPPLPMGGNSRSRRFLVKYRKDSAALPRYADSAFFGTGQLSCLRAFEQMNVFGRISGKPIARVTADTVARCIRAVFSNANITPHSVRRFKGVRLFLRLVDDLTARAGSSIIRLAHGAWQFGHSSITVLPCSYAGTALCVISEALPDLNSAHERTVARSCMSEAKLVQGLVVDTERMKLHGAILRRQLRAALAAVGGISPLAPQPEPLSDLDCDGTFELTCETESTFHAVNSPLGLRFYAGPDIDTLCTCVRQVFESAKTKKVSVRCFLVRWDPFPVSKRKLRLVVDFVLAKLASDVICGSSSQPES